MDNILTLPFNLELAVKGHPLVRRNGDKVTSFHYIREDKGNFPCVSCANGHVSFHNISGNNGSAKGDDHDLLLDLSVNWIKPLQLGSIIEVYEDKGKWVEALFIKRGYDDGVIALYEEIDIESFKKGGPFTASLIPSGNWRLKQTIEEDNYCNVKDVLHEAKIIVDQSNKMISNLARVIEDAKKIISQPWQADQ